MEINKNFIGKMNRKDKIHLLKLTQTGLYNEGYREIIELMDEAILRLEKEMDLFLCDDLPKEIASILEEMETRKYVNHKEHYFCGLTEPDCDEFLKKMFEHGFRFDYDYKGNVNNLRKLDSSKLYNRETTTYKLNSVSCWFHALTWEVQPFSQWTVVIGSNIFPGPNDLEGCQKEWYRNLSVEDREKLIKGIATY